MEKVVDWLFGGLFTVVMLLIGWVKASTDKRIDQLDGCKQDKTVCLERHDAASQRFDRIQADMDKLVERLDDRDDEIFQRLGRIEIQLAKINGGN